MQLRCYRCGWSFAIKKEEAEFALQALEETGGNHYDTSCPRCRHSNRVSLEQLRKAVPRSMADSEPQESEDAETAEPTLQDGEVAAEDLGEEAPSEDSEPVG